MKAYTINTEFDASDKYIVDNIIARKSITLIVASPKKGKTALGLNLGICINEGIDFLENKVNKTKVVYYCNELSGRLIQERINRLDLPCPNTMKFYEGTSYVDFDELERIIKSDVELGYEVFVVDTFSKIKYDRKYNANDYNDTYEVMAKYYELIEKYGCTFIMMYHTKKDSSIKSVSEKVIGSQALSGSVDTIIAINKSSEFDTEFSLDVTSRLFESKVYQVKIHPLKKILELDKVDPIEMLEPSIQRLVQVMPRLKEIEGTIVDICSKINLEIESPQQFGKTLNRNKDILRKNGISITMKRGKNNNNYQIKYNAEDVIY
ncbi:TPA: AAA family ATPase [Streptococcus equi subsp. zooepidemicus]|nr:AAA family ATPase [Streptococcus equi subsp. zooepidemicus]HEL0427905.1 AAA family ATPase [Streptococcus equi subsp. zooepidemicus]HEL0429843.1 AAA family ATPase [Streptococcus equi subsp. zooepidemicus]HEL0434203.1 AAA family ATPase [Streptococcus equi subsp. zooepidemicus]HEL0438278.1 AAA family ATPase [Streptococcus equi subsp. zooepidemicus]